ncbi:MAG: hypothetical protein J6T89_00170 [Bacteroidales bacterium]|nr:hypothetical protein [Bacteroidales bacterium]
MKKFILVSTIVLLSLTSAFAQGKKTEIKAGDISFGVNVNPMTAFAESKWKPEDGAFSGAWTKDIGDVPAQMYILSKDPVASFKLRFHMSESVALRAQLGITGSIINQKDYVQDDYSHYLSPVSENKVVDQVSSKLNAASLGLALEMIKGNGPLKFNASIGVLYAIAGGSMDFKYGNPFNKDWNGNVPTSTAYTQKLEGGNKVADSLNDGAPVGHLGITYARPLKRFNVGYTNALGISIDMGVEWFFAGQMSLGAALTFTPVMLLFQPQTYTTYEGFTTMAVQGGSDEGSVIEYNKLVSPGSTGILYGTDNFGLRLSLNYYL